VFVLAASSCGGTAKSALATTSPEAATTALTDDSLSSISCISASDCQAVGSSGDYRFPLIEHWNGTEWSVTKVAHPLPTSSSSGSFHGLSCITASNCQAVGNYFIGKRIFPLSERWNGTEWSIVKIPWRTKNDAQLSGIACVSVSDCVAVGHRRFATPLTLIEHWDGRGWSTDVSPNPALDGPNDGVYLEGVSCVSATDCMAAGYHGAGPKEPLFEHWNGVIWSIVTSPVSAYTDAQMSGISCTSTGDCYASGDSYADGGVPISLIEHWDGEAWSIMKSSDVGSQGSRLGGISCVSSTSCEAVGSYPLGNISDSDERDYTLFEHWDGLTWSGSIGPSTPGAQQSLLDDVSCISASDCLAVGTSFISRTESWVTLAAQWSGNHWYLMKSPSPS